MADLAHPLGIAAQIRLIAGLRWRMVWNGLRRQNSKMDTIGMMIAGVFGAILVIGLCFAFAAGAYAFVLRGSVEWLGLLFWGIFLFWQVFPIFAAGFGQQFEFRSLRRYPLSLGAFYSISLAYGLADFAAVASLCWLLAMTLGATAARPDLLPAMVFVCGLFLLANVTLERLLGSWLERLLARRRTRELVFALFILLCVSAQFVAPAVEKWGSSAAPRVQRVLPIFAVFPPGLAGRAISSAASSHFASTLLYFAGIGAYALLAGTLLWLRLSAQYRGEDLTETAAPSIARGSAAAAITTAAAQDFRWLSPQVGAMLRKEFRYLRRNSFAFLNLLLPPMFVLLLSSQIGMISRRHPNAMSQGVPVDLLFPGMLAYLILILTAPAYNCFAYESHGIKTLFTSPLRFRDVLVGKNLLLLGTLTAEIALCIGTLALRVGIPPPPQFIATLVAIVFSVSGQLIIANWSSLNFPRKLEFGSLRNQRASGMAVLLAFGTQIVLGAACGVVFLAGRWSGNPWLPVGIFSLLAVATVGGYFSSLEPLSQLAEKKREVLLDALCR